MYNPRPIRIIDHKPKADDFKEHYQVVHDWRVAIGAPAAQSAISGVFVAILIGVVFMTWRYALIAWAAVQAVVWLGLLYRWLGGLSRVEQLIGRDINQDGVIGPPPVEPQTVRVEVLEDGGRRATFADLDVEPRKLGTMASALLAGGSFSEGALTGRGAPFSRAEFRMLRDVFLRRGWAAWRNPSARAQGLELTAAGRSICRYFNDTDLVDLPTPSNGNGHKPHV